MQYDINVLSKLAAKLGVVRNTLEKVIRLSEILRFINSNETLKERFALKGGTAINLLYTQLPRLSVDIDLDYAVNDSKENMLIKRTIIKNILEKYFTNEGYILSKNSRYSYTLDSFVITYIPSGGGSDNIKVEINYSMRNHLLPLEYKMMDFGIINDPFPVLTVSKIEIYAGKINALVSRNQIRDLYDTYQMINRKMISLEEESMLKKILLFYRYIQNDTLSFNSQFDKRFTRKSYVRDLLPVIRKGDSFDLDTAIEVVRLYINDLINYDSNELIFIQSIDTNIPRFDLLFHNEVITNKAKSHPLTLWRIANTNRQS